MKGKLNEKEGQGRAGKAASTDWIRAVPGQSRSGQGPGPEEQKQTRAMQCDARQGPAGALHPTNPSPPTPTRAGQTLSLTAWDAFDSTKRAPVTRLKWWSTSAMQRSAKSTWRVAEV